MAAFAIQCVKLSRLVSIYQNRIEISVGKRIAVHERIYSYSHRTKALEQRRIIADAHLENTLRLIRNRFAIRKHFALPKSSAQHRSGSPESHKFQEFAARRFWGI